MKATKLLEEKADTVSPHGVDVATALNCVSIDVIPVVSEFSHDLRKRELRWLLKDSKDEMLRFSCIFYLFLMSDGRTNGPSRFFFSVFLFLCGGIVKFPLLCFASVSHVLMRSSDFIWPFHLMRFLHCKLMHPLMHPSKHTTSFPHCKTMRSFAYRFIDRAIA